jgi:metallo-beta-lactamase family protein
VVVESTYGNRLHAPDDSGEALAQIVRKTAGRGGIVLVPSFAVGRAQTLLYLTHLLKSSGRIPNLPVFLNSPMAVDATRIYHEHRSEHRLSAQECASMCGAARFVNTVEESKALNDLRMPSIIIAASGMATGGRVLHHLKAFAPDPRNTVLFTGFQAGGTRGASMLAGAASVKIHGREVPVRAEVAALDTLSAHADWRETLGWLEGFGAEPRRTFITHGEPAAADALRLRIAEARGWQCHVPDYLEEQDIEI